MSEHLLLNAKEAAQALSISPRKLWELTNRGQVPHIRLGRRVLYPMNSLRAMIDAKLPKEFREKGGESA